ncbi:MAG TPA: S8/S53 family peptidase [Thermoanaerobaculia bacterium]|jgi:hypothetical protein
MFDKSVLQRDIEAARDALPIDFIQNAKREHGLRFIVDAREGRSLPEVTSAVRRVNERFVVQPLFPEPVFSPETNPSWSKSIFIATVDGVAFDDVSIDAPEIAESLRGEGDFVRVAPDRLVAAPERSEERASEERPMLEWEFHAMKIKKAWTEIVATRSGDRARPGNNVRIAHPDTGWYYHQVWNTGVTEHRNLDHRAGWNFVENFHNGGEWNALDRMDGPFNGHGTSTASVMVSHPNRKVSGVAPWATVIPIRAGRSVVLNGGVAELTKAIEFARTKTNCRIISMSLGWYDLDPILRKAIQEAVKQNIIVVAAAGQYYLDPLTCEPANYSEVVGVAGIDGFNRLEEGAPWKFSHRNPGGTITISAPATPVRRAKATAGSRDTYDDSEGTSYATAFIAGIAAMWLSYHFHDGYTGDIPAYQCFKEHLQRTAARHWPNEEKWYVGLVDAEALIMTKPKNNQ